MVRCHRALTDTDSAGDKRLTVAVPIASTIVVAGVPIAQRTRLTRKIGGTR